MSVSQKWLAHQATWFDYLILACVTFLHHQAKSLLSKAQREPTIVCHVCQNWLVQQAWFALFTKLPNVTEQCNRPLA
ncbi:hypothetical protein TIFTF001_026207 [Ficus carica]|uniref:Uncharacterized protein n=1 Tax=Ficus carica TaxID=3494 RepID=A0AA88DKU5_FICCA|nr:hypothetical protein TIFTF001_026207 [Ficus carica]